MTVVFLVFFALVAHATEGPIAEPVSASSFQRTLEQVNAAVAPMVRKDFGSARRFLATGDWKQEYSPSSPGGSFYHPDMPGVEYDDRWGVHISGWVARWSGFTTDTVSFVLCHELGHHIFGGEDEVGADHFAPKCLRWVWSEGSNARWGQIQRAAVPRGLQTLCPEVDDGGFCRRVLAAYLPVESFRTDIWTRLKVFGRRSEIERTHLCRRSAVLRGIRNEPAPGCRL